ncbi:cell number regulator 13-like isoform X1 [Musa acuminata AAA Group]|uniref:cell number regulator 13-like isoform X1 n=1 Tax=Musa acuminata AAA Group TaxID=214697 RepID=UPI0031D58015
MASSWEYMGDVANVVQLTGLDAVRLIGMIVKAASVARMHKKNCRRFAQHLKLIGSLLEQLKISELKRYPETREPLEQLEDALRRSYILVNSCQDRSYLYLLAMGWNIVYQFRRAQSEIDRYLRLIPLITLVDKHRIRERLEYIERDQCEYSFDEEDRKVQDVLLNPVPCKSQSMVLKKSLSCSDSSMSFDEALQKENEKLQMELQRSQTNLDVGACELIQQLLGLTETMASAFPENTVELKNYENVESASVDVLDGKEDYSSYGKYYSQQDDTCKASSRTSSIASSGHDLLSNKASSRYEEWHSDLLGCCSEPFLCIKTCCFPCGTFSKIASVAKNRHVSSAEACNDFMAYALVLSCCCYTCCIRRKLRKMLNITGGLCDDFLSHLMCCCCAFVQEWREVEFRGTNVVDKTKTNPPASQYMES